LKPHLQNFIRAFRAFLYACLYCTVPGLLVAALPTQASS